MWQVRGAAHLPGHKHSFPQAQDEARSPSPQNTAQETVGRGLGSPQARMEGAGVSTTAKTGVQTRVPTMVTMVSLASSR